MFYRKTYIEISLDALEHNIKSIQKYSNQALFCVCKADAYSHHAYTIANKATQLGCPYICVSSLDEAIALRIQGLQHSILILGVVEPEDVQVACDYNITLSVSSKEWVLQVINKLKKGSKWRAHLKIDTGMNRIGIKQLGEAKEVLKLLLRQEVEVEGIFTHLHSANTPEDESSLKQLDWFYKVVEQLNHSFVWVHTSNSDATTNQLDFKSNAQRVGLSLYGIQEHRTKLDLKPVLSFYSSIVQIKKVNKGESVGYGATYICPKDCFIATVPVGYGDGFVRKNQGRYVCIEGSPFEIVGRICMDQMMVVVDKEYQLGTLVEIIGEHIDVTTMAKQLDTISYEVLCLLNDRIPKVIKKDDKVVDVIQLRLPNKREDGE